MRDPAGMLTAGVDTMTDWRHTAWGNRSLAHLEGVGPWLRGEMEATRKKEMDMNLLAEFGPQDLAQAWAYFKHWVKGRPVGMHCALDDKLPGNGEEPLHFNRSQLKQMDSNYDSAPHETARRSAVAFAGPATAFKTPEVVGGRTWAERDAELRADAVSLDTPFAIRAPPPSPPPRERYYGTPVQPPPTQPPMPLATPDSEATIINARTPSFTTVPEQRYSKSGFASGYSPMVGSTGTPEQQEQSDAIADLNALSSDFVRDMEADLSASLQ